MSNRLRYPAAFMVAVGIGFPALAAASAGSNPPARAVGKSPRPVKVRGRAPNLLSRPIRQLRRTIRVQVHEIRAKERRNQQHSDTQLPGGVSLATLDAIAQCESGGNPTAVSADGTYRGKYQFDYGTWASIGGHGDPAAAPVAEQDYRAALLYERSGTSPWPICG